MKNNYFFLLLLLVSFNGWTQDFKAMPVGNSLEDFSIDRNSGVSAKLNNNFLKHSLFTLDTKNLKSHVRKYKNGKIQFDLSLPELGTLNIAIEENDILSEDYKLVVASDKGNEVYKKQNA